MDKRNDNLEIGCGYCIHELLCMKHDPKINKAKLGCKEYLHYKDSETYKFKSTLLTTPKEVLALLKSLGINTKGLQPYSILYKTNWNTFGYKDSSMWAFTYSTTQGTIEVHTTYFSSTAELRSYNQAQSKLYWTARYNDEIPEVQRKPEWVQIKKDYIDEN